MTEEVCAVLPQDHPLATRTALTLADLADEPWVLTPRSSWEPWHRSYDDDFATAGYTPTSSSAPPPSKDCSASSPPESASPG